MNRFLLRMSLPGDILVSYRNGNTNFHLFISISSGKCGQSVCTIGPNNQLNSEPYPTLIGASTSFLLFLIYYIETTVMGSPGRIGLCDIYLIFGKKTLHIFYRYFQNLQPGLHFKHPGLHFRHPGLNFITVGTERCTFSATS